MAKIVKSSIEYFPNSSSGIPIANGYIYVGLPDLDPTIVANQLQLSVQEEDGTIVEVDQPIRTSGGGVPLYDGSPVTLLVTGNYSLKVLNSAESQIYYVPLIQSTEIDETVYYPDYTATDHGVAGNSNTIKYYVDLIGTTNKATLYLKHNDSGEYTDYIFLTSETIPSNINIIIENGARLSPAVGITTTINSWSTLTLAFNQVWITGAGTVTITDSNLALGHNNLQSIVATSGIQNIAIGTNVLTALTTGDRNVGIGIGVMPVLTTANLNIGIGFNALAAVTTTGVENVAIGGSVLAALTTGADNVGIGGSATLQSATTATRNIGIGVNALNATIDGGNNIAIGYNSQRYDVTGDAASNISIGSSSMSVVGRDSGDNNVAIGHQSLEDITTGSGLVVIGTGALKNYTVGISAIAIGLSAAQFLSNGTTPLTDGDYNIFIGNAAKGSDTDGDANMIVIGRNAIGIGPNSAVLGHRDHTDFTQTHGTILQEQPTPQALTTSTLLTIANLLDIIIVGTHAAGANQNYQLPTGPNIDAGGLFANNDSFDWTVINASAAAADTITITANTSSTLIGLGVIASAHATTGGLYGNAVTFRTRKTATDTFITYRIG